MKYTLMTQDEFINTSLIDIKNYISSIEDEDLCKDNIKLIAATVKGFLLMRAVLKMTDQLNMVIMVTPEIDTATLVIEKIKASPLDSVGIGFLMEKLAETEKRLHEDREENT